MQSQVIELGYVEEKQNIIVSFSKPESHDHLRSEMGRFYLN